ncbi:MAG: 2-oxoacid:acceptor oxidoreductase family protein [Deltaproteobacteria bacterium]|nr:2-oxoacid:acceptor oxidoreductase family protein [Deltaproteobacteria bacterium]
MEIRLHGRGGQGGVTGAKILAAIYSRLGKKVQAFGDYAGERAGAPVRAYTRVDDNEIVSRNKVYNPDHLLVLDPTLLGPEVLAGLKPGGILLINTPKSPDEIADLFPGTRLATVDATSIARGHGIGTRTVVIVNTTISGAFARLMGIDWETVEQAYEDLGLDSNLAAAQEAFELVKVREIDTAAMEDGAPAMQMPVPPRVLDLLDHVEGAPTGLKTGSWRTQLPRYVRALAPCTASCPAGNDVEAFVQALARKDEVAAAEVLADSTPLAAVCGRVCPGFCKSSCNRIDYDGAVDTRALERWIADHAHIARTDPDAVVGERRRIGIVGGGPAGLSAAYQLARDEHRVVIFDGEEKLGGVLRTGIPTFRLPRDVLDREVSAVLELGVVAETGVFLSRGRIKELASEFDALIIATGLQKLRGLDVPGADFPQVEQGIRYLHRVNLESEQRLSGHVVVLGGGNTAMDCARSALRQGAEKVTVAYRRTAKEMPAIAEEVEEALEEGVVFHFQLAPTAFYGEGKLEAIELAEVEMGEPDESGRRSPVVTDRKQKIACDHVLLALGQSADLSLLPEGWEMKDGRVFDGEKALNVWVAGDLSTWEGTVAHAIGDGRLAATRLLRELGEDVELFVRPAVERAVGPKQVNFAHFAKRKAEAHERMSVEERLKAFMDVDAGLPSGSLEAQRCLSCGDCTECDTCMVFCPEGIIHRNGAGYMVDADYCKGCGICVAECPRGAMEMVNE